MPATRKTEVSASPVGQSTSSSGFQDFLSSDDHDYKLADDGKAVGGGAVISYAYATQHDIWAPANEEDDTSATSSKKSDNKSRVSHFVYAIQFNPDPPKSLLRDFKYITAIVSAEHLVIVRISPDGDTTQTGEVFVVPDQKGDEKGKKEKEDLYTLQWIKDPINRTIWSAVAFAGSTGVIRIIDLCINPLRTGFLRGHAAAVNELCYHEDFPAFLLSASKDHTIRMWSIKYMICLAMFGGAQGHKAEIITLDMHFTGQYMVSGFGTYNAKRRYHFRDVSYKENQGIAKMDVKESEGQCWSIQYTFNLWLAVCPSQGSFDSFIKIWNLFGSENEQLLDNIRIHGISSDPQPCIVSAPIFSVNDVHDRQIDCVRWILRDPVNYYLVSKASDETILIWMPMLSEANKTPGVRTEWQLCHKIRLKNNKFWFIKFALSYEPYCVLALGDDLGCIKLHDIYALAAKTKFAMNTLKTKKNRGSSPNKGTIRSVAFSRDGLILIGGNDDGMCHIFRRLEKKSKTANERAMDAGFNHFEPILADYD